MFEFELGGQQVVTGLRQLALCVVELGLGIEHIDIDAHADFVTQFIGFQSALAGFFSRF